MQFLLNTMDASTLSTKQENHLEYLKLAFACRMEGKYRRGAKEHGGNLLGMSPRQLIEEALDEAVDQVAFLLTALDALPKDQ